MAVALEIRQGDITEADTEAIVNAANNHLWMGAGVAGAIKRKGGQVIEDEAVAKGPVDVGQVVATTAGDLRYKYVIHAAGMGQDLKTDERLVDEATRNAILLADKLEVKSLAIPAIGTGVGGFSMESCAEVMINAAMALADQLENLGRIIFVLFDSESYETFKREINR